MAIVSVIVPVYNASKTLRRCLDSILGQSFSDLEVIAVNDGSSDDSLAILEEYSRQDSRVKIISQANAGVSAARNAGLWVATGEWIAFCDSDDDVNADWIKNLYSVSAKADFVGSGIKFFQGDDCSVETLQPLKGTRKLDILISALVENKVFGFTFCKLFKRQIILEHKVFFDKSIAFREDELWVVSYLEHVNGWSLTNSADYNYYLPTGPKKYRGSFTDFIKPIFCTYRRIFPKELPIAVAKFYYKMVRNMIVEQIKSNKGVEGELIDIFKYLKASLNSRSIKAKTVDWVLTTYSNSWLAKQIFS